MTLTVEQDPTIEPSWWTTDEWSTPQDVFARIADLYGPFDLDPCARPDTAKAQQFYTKAENGLLLPWRGRVFVNPPYSDPSPWVERAVKAVYGDERAHVVMLLPASTDTAWFHDLVLPYAEIVYLRGRVKFLRWDGKPKGTPKGGNILALFPKRSNVLTLAAE